MSHISIVWDKQDDGHSLGATSEHFIAIWGEGFDAHATFCVPPEWQPLADRIEEVLREFAPIRPVFEWPKLEPKPVVE